VRIGSGQERDVAVGVQRHVARLHRSGPGGYDSQQYPEHTTFHEYLLKMLSSLQIERIVITPNLVYNRRWRKAGRARNC
jgi:hypothetical protein